MRVVLTKSLMIVYLSIITISTYTATTTDSFVILPSHRHQNVGGRWRSSLYQEQVLEQEQECASQPLEQEGSINENEATKILASDDDFIKPDLDTRKYRAIRLNNNLDVLLVSSKDTDVEAGSVHLSVGHMQDPKNRAGLAHFNEHMLFLGTTKYPDENEYDAFLRSNGGSSNAYTDMEDTNYYFSITPPTSSSSSSLDNNHDKDEAINGNDNVEIKKTSDIETLPLYGALDRFAQFFKSPKFDENMMERELRAIDSEHKNALNSDTWRNFMLLKTSSNADHPFSKFGCGNYNTLTDGGQISGSISKDINEKIINNTEATTSVSSPTIYYGGGSSPKQDLLKFWNTYYKTYNMKLCVAGKSSLDDLQSIVEKTFGQIPYSEGQPLCQYYNKEYTSYNNIKAFRSNSELGKIIYVKPIQETRVLKIHFQVPPTVDPIMKDNQPSLVISHILGHESHGSLHWVLNEELGYITGLSAGISVNTNDFALFTITISLTPNGSKHIDAVTDLTFQYISFVKDLANDNEELLSSFHEELQQISALNFKYRENSKIEGFVSQASKVLFRNEPSRILIGNAPTLNNKTKLNCNVTRDFLNERIRPENSLIYIINSDLKNEEEQKNEDDNPPLTINTAVNGNFSATLIPHIGKVNDGKEWEVEKWYGGVYKKRNIPTEIIEKWNSYSITRDGNVDSRLKLPSLNKYIPTDFTLRCKNLTKEQYNSNFEDEDSWLEPPQLLPISPQEYSDAVEQSDKLRLWHKLDRCWKVPRTQIKISLVSPDAYKSPRSITLNRIFQRVLRDDLNSFVYDANVAGCSYGIAATPTGFHISIAGYSDKLSFLLDTLTSRMLSLIAEMKEGAEKHPSLHRKFNKARETLLRLSKNQKLNSPLGLASYSSRLLIEENVWHVESYIQELNNGNGANHNSLSMEECARVAEECLLGKLRADVLCIGNINVDEARNVSQLVESHFLKSPSRPAEASETPSFRSLKLPTKAEAINIFGPGVTNSSVPVVLEEVAYSKSEENNAVEVVLQAGCELDLGHKGVALLALFSNIAYNSAFSQLRTKEQLGYIVSCFARKTAGSSRGFSIVVQSSVKTPSYLEERIEAWLALFRTELEKMSAEKIASEADAVVAQFLERDTRMNEEVTRAWSAIVETQRFASHKLRTPAFDRNERIAAELITSSDDDDDEEECTGASLKKQTPEELKRDLIAFYDKHFAANSHDRRAMSARVYNHKSKSVYQDNIGKPGVLSTYEDTLHLKQFLSSWPVVPYWRSQ